MLPASIDCWCSAYFPSISTLLFIHYFVLAPPPPKLLPSGGRGSYNDMGGPVITTQVTIPKDVSKWQQHYTQTGTPKKDTTTHPHDINNIQSE